MNNERTASWMILILLILDCKCIDFINPPRGDIDCSNTEQCNLVCTDGDYVCSFDTWTFTNVSNVTIYCNESSFTACMFTMYAYNVNNIEILIDPIDILSAVGQNTNVFVDGIYSYHLSYICNARCVYPNLWLSAPNLNAIIECTEGRTCDDMLISAMEIAKLSIFCASNACRWMVIFPPIKQFSESTSDELFYIDVTTATEASQYYSEINSYVFALDGLQYTTINCRNDECPHWMLYYGIEMERSCNLFNCTHYIDPTVQSNDAIYYVHINASHDNDIIEFPTLDSMIYDTLVIFIGNNEDAAPKTIISPSITNCIIICMDESIWQNDQSCYGLTANLSLAMNATMYTNARDMNIYGSQHSFSLNTWYDNMMSNNYYLENTQIIKFNCDCDDCSKCGRTSNIYVGLSENVNIFCGVDGCIDFTLYSDYNFSANLLDYVWNIDCNTAYPDACSNFVLNFALGDACTYETSIDITCPTNDPTTEPTSEPTLEPTLYPSAPTMEPTAEPSSDPTFEPTIPTQNPTLYPSVDPTIVPTQDPTTNPSVDPSIDPTSDPTIYPTADPSIDPTADPSIDPTSDPTTNPSVDPTADPTVNPTIYPTVNPTTSDPTSAASTIVSLTVAIPATGSSKSELNTTTENIIIVGAIVLAFLLILASCYYFRKKSPKPAPRKKSTATELQIVNNAGTPAATSPFDEDAAVDDIDDIDDNNNNSPFLPDTSANPFLVEDNEEEDNVSASEQRNNWTAFDE